MTYFVSLFMNSHKRIIDNVTQADQKPYSLVLQPLVHFAISTSHTATMKGTYIANILKDTWFLQTLAVCGSMLLVGVLAALLIYFDNKLVFDWNGITLNAIVALVATILKALVAFTVSECIGQAKWIWLSWQQRPVRDLALIDEASRGPLGSVKILWTPVARSFISFGAMIIILSTAMDPFVHLTVGKSNMVIYANDSSAQISYARRYSKSSTRTQFPDQTCETFSTDYLV